MRRQQVLLNLGVFVLALVPRVMPTPFHTTDEMSFWLVRSTNFLTALRTGDFIETAQTYHPGVTTMWLGSAGILLIEMVTGQAVADLDLFQYLGLIRLPAAVLHALLITLAYALLLRRLLGEWVALLGTIFWATNLFHIAHSQVLHVDALTTTFVTVAFLAGLVAFHADDEPQAADVRWGWLFASAVFAGLATMTKLTLLYVSAPLGLVALEMREAWLRQPNRWRRLLRYVVLPMALWTVAVGLTCLFVYPALWLGDFATVIERMERGFALATSAHSGGNYFWGEPTSIPGRGFYWVALSMRLSPWVMVGVLVAIVRIFRRGWHGRTTVAALLFYAIGLIILMDLQPKKFDRYLLPIFPVLDFIAAAGLVWIVGITARYPQGVARVPARAAWVSTVGVLALLAAWYHPYAQAYY